MEIKNENNLNEDIDNLDLFNDESLELASEYETPQTPKEKVKEPVDPIKESKDYQNALVKEIKKTMPKNLDTEEKKTAWLQANRLTIEDTVYKNLKPVMKEDIETLELKVRKSREYLDDPKMKFDFFYNEKALEHKDNVLMLSMMKKKFSGQALKEALKPQRNRFLAERTAKEKARDEEAKRRVEEWNARLKNPLGPKSTTPTYREWKETK